MITRDDSYDIKHSHLQYHRLLAPTWDPLVDTMHKFLELCDINMSELIHFESHFKMHHRWLDWSPGFISLFA